MRALVVCTLFLSLIGVGHNSFAANWPDLPKACLPEAGRMSPSYDWGTGKEYRPVEYALTDPRVARLEINNEYSPCHCPPKSFCPEEGTFGASKDLKMPPNFIPVCCKPPSTCDYSNTRTYISETHGGGGGGFDPFSSTVQRDYWCKNFALSDDFAGSEDLRSDVERQLRRVNRCLDRANIDTSAWDAEHFTERNISTNFGFNSIDQLQSAAPASNGAHMIRDQEYQSCYDRFVHALDVGDMVPPLRQSLTSADAATVLSDAGEYEWRPSFNHDVNSRWQQAVERLNSETVMNHALRLYDIPNMIECTQLTFKTMCVATIKIINNNGKSCLAPETMVQLEGGMSKRISLIRAGDIIATPNGSAVVDEVVRLQWPQLVLYSINNDVLRLTADHPVKTTEGWKAINYDGGEIKYALPEGEVKPLKVGDILITEEGELEVTSITPSATLTNQVTYNLRLDKHDMFYANGILVRDN